MCFGGGGPTQAENKAAAEDRIAAEDAKRAEAERRAKQKREDISEAITARTVKAGRQGGSGRRSLYSASSGEGFLSRF